LFCYRPGYTSLIGDAKNNCGFIVEINCVHGFVYLRKA